MTVPFGPYPDPGGHAAEAALLGAMLHSHEVAVQVVSELGPDDLDRDAHRTVLGAVRGLLDADAHVDVVTVTSWLAKLDRLDEVGGAGALADLLTECPEPHHWRTYLRIVAADADRRRQVAGHLEALRALGVDVREVAA